MQQLDRCISMSIIESNGFTSLFFFNRYDFSVFVVAAVRADKMRQFWLFTLGAETQDRLIQLVMSSSFSAS